MNLTGSRSMLWVALSLLGCTALPAAAAAAAKDDRVRTCSTR